ncbi:hypothetical protein EV715DRAFT_200974 [Schizophyllum commune]
MHPAFNIAELCFMIARTDALHRPDLCCLALVCRHWRDVAEAVLWEKLPDFDHLLMLMPPDVWSFTPKRDWRVPRVLVTARDIVPEDWAPVLSKSKLVRRLTINSAYAHLCQDLETVTAFLKLGFGPTRELDDPLIRNLETLSPRIASLELHFLLSFKNLDVDDAYLSRISALPSLTRLSLHHMRSAPPEPITYPPTSFARLRDLSTNGTPVATLVDIIRLAGARLERIYSTFRSLDVAQVELLVRFIRDCCSPETSITLYITSEALDGDGYLDYFRPIAHFKHLDIFLRKIWSNPVRTRLVPHHHSLFTPQLCSLLARDSVLGSMDLARLALVSRFWREVAEEVLWEDLPDVLCLLRLLPEDLWYMETEPSTDGSYHSEDELRVFKFRRELESTDWTSLLPKSGLVKILTVAASLSAEVQQVIIGCPPPLKVLPRLETLCLARSTNPTFLGAFVPLDTITALRITYPGASIHSSTVSLLNSCANVTSLTLKLHLVGASKQTKAEALLTAVTEAKRVQSLSLLLTMEFALPSERFMHFMSQLPALTNLDIRLNRCEGAKDYRPIAYASPSFVHLRTLKLSRHSTQMLADILRASSPSYLRFIDLMYFALEEADVEPLISTIFTYFARSALRKLSIAASNFFGSADWRWLTPLAAFEQLEVRFMDQAVPYTWLNTASSVA